MKELLESIIKRYTYPNRVIKKNHELVAWLKSQVNQPFNSIEELVFLYKNPEIKSICEFGNHRKFHETAYRKGCGGRCKCSAIASKNTLLKKYGVDNPAKSKTIQEKIKKTNIQKYGVDNPNKTTQIKLKKKEVFLKKYGVDCALKSPAVRQKIVSTNLKKYGTTSTLIAADTQDKIKKTLVERYGVAHPKQVHLKPETIEKYNNRDWMINQHHIQKKSCEQISKELNVGPTLILNKMKILNIELLHFTASSLEREIVDFIHSKNPMIEIKTNVKSIIPPLELDIFVPEKNLAIEVCGLYWHSEVTGKRPVNYHLNKMKKCLEKNIRLITVFSDEWLNKKEIVKNRLSYVLGMVESICGARETDVYPISSELYKSFVDQYHIQGSIASKIKLGAFYNDQLIAAMGLGARRRNLGAKNTGPNDYEMLRFCSKGHIPGVGSKLFKYFIDNYSPTQVTSYADRRWGEGEFYRHLGFEFVKSTGPSYFYTNDFLTRHNRFIFRKDIILREMGGDCNLTEWQNMQVFGYDRIWDCGTNKWVWNKK